MRDADDRAALEKGSTRSEGSRDEGKTRISHRRYHLKVGMPDSAEAFSAELAQGDR